MREGTSRFASKGNISPIFRRAPAWVMMSMRPRSGTLRVVRQRKSCCSACALGSSDLTGMGGAREIGSGVGRVGTATTSRGDAPWTSAEIMRDRTASATTAHGTGNDCAFLARQFCATLKASWIGLALTKASIGTDVASNPPSLRPTWMSPNEDAPGSWRGSRMSRGLPLFGLRVCVLGKCLPERRRCRRVVWRAGCSGLARLTDTSQLGALQQ